MPDGTQVASLFGVLSLQDDFTPALQKSMGALGIFGDAFSGVTRNLREFGAAATIGLTAPIVAGFGLAIKAASDHEAALAQLNQELFVTADHTEAASASTGHWAVATEATGAKADKMRSQVEMLNAQISQHEAQLGRAKGAHQILSVTIDQEIEKRDKLNAALGANTVGQKIWVDAAAQTAQVTHMTSDALQQLAQGFSEETRYSKDSIISSEAMMLTFRSVGKDVFPQATQAVLDMSTAMGQDLKSSTVELGKALEDPAKGLTALMRIGVSFTEAQKEQIKAMQRSGDMMGAQKLILAEVEHEFGGAAQAAGGTFAGQLDIASHAITDLLAVIGQQMLPVLSGIITGITSVVSAITTNLDPGIIQAGIVIGILVAAIGPVVAAIGSIGVVLGLVLSPVGLIILGIAGLAAAFATNFGGVRDAVLGVWNAIQPTIDKFKAIGTDVMDGLQYIFNPPSSQAATGMPGDNQQSGRQPRRAGGRQMGGDAGDGGGQDAVLIPDFGTRVSNEAGSLLSTVTYVLTNLASDIGKWVTGTGIPLISAAITKLFNVDIPTMVASVVAWGAQTLPGVFAGIGAFVSGIGQWITTTGIPAAAAALTKLFNVDIPSIAAAVVAWGNTALPSITASILLIVSNLGSWVTNSALPEVGKAFVKLFNIDPSTVTSITTPLNTLWTNSIKPAVDAIVSGVQGFVKNFQGLDLSGIENIFKIISGAAAGIGVLVVTLGAGVIKGIADALQPFGAAIADIIKAVNSLGKGDLGGVFSALADGIKNIVTALGNIVGGVIDGFVKFVTTLLGIDPETVKTGWNKIGDALKTAAGTIQLAFLNLPIVISNAFHSMERTVLNAIINILKAMGPLLQLLPGGTMGMGAAQALLASIPPDAAMNANLPGAMGPPAPSGGRGGGGAWQGWANGGGGSSGQSMNSAASGAAFASQSAGNSAASTQTVINLHNPQFHGVTDVSAFFDRLQNEAGKRGVVLGSARA